jgi:hypothetical protein
MENQENLAKELKHEEKGEEQASPILRINLVSHL